MNSLFTLYSAAWQDDLSSDQLYQVGNAAGWLSRGDKQASVSYPLSGRLYLAKSGWLLLSVPNALVRGVFDALTAPGAELPLAGTMNVPNVDSEVLNAHISVMTGDEVASIGANKINERGHHFGYTLGPIREIDIKKMDGVSKVWAIEVSAPGLSALRKSYGLPPLPNGDHQFHITVAVRRKHVLGNNDVSKFDAASGRGELKAAADLLPGGAGDNKPDSDFSHKALEEGSEHEHEHTSNDQIAKEIAKDHLSEDPRYYEKQEALEKESRPQILKELLEAKEHSDNKRYEHKAAILRRLMRQAPQDWVIDDPKPRNKGVTHTPTKFKFHTPPETIPPVVKAAGNSVYFDQLKNMTVSREPFVYDYNKPVFANIQNQMKKLKQRGDWILQARRNQDIYRAAIDPRYRHELAMRAFHGTMPQPSYIDQLIERYGDNFLGAPQ